jgi:regulator of protease activity HflC (stomatin/prohibitin superfamily)
MREIDISGMSRLQFEAAVAVARKQLEAKNREEGAEKLAEAVANFEAALEEAKSIAREYDLSFNISPAYGMGGTYDGAAAKNWDESDSYDEKGWYPSSQGC